MHSIYDWFSRHRFAVDVVLMSVLWLMAMPLSISDGGYMRTLVRCWWLDSSPRHY